MKRLFILLFLPILSCYGQEDTDMPPDLSDLIFQFSIKTEGPLHPEWENGCDEVMTPAPFTTP